MDLFQHGKFRLAGGRESPWKIECNSLGHSDWAAVADMLAKLVQPFGECVGVPRGGLPLAEAMKVYATEGPLLVCDDCWTTGGSMVRFLAERPRFAMAKGAVLFSRGETPPWVTVLLRLNPGLDGV